ncbi:amidase [Saccharopolyspora pogona]|uniref:amidase n=1 Tax=Saccharopolyspora pogona TaxID=333966 RepID=UPI00168511B6|nr:amidase [Saccharopolyspora pogona]
MPSSLGVEPSPHPPGYFADADLAGLAAALRSGRLSAVDLTETAIGEATRWQPAINAFVALDESGARAAAVVASRELANGVDRGPLHGIPIAVKDMIHVQGLPTTAGSRHLTAHVAQRDAECVRRLRAAGAVVIGKTTTHEFANGPTGDRSATGATRNPHALERMAGGSSSGSAAAVAAGIVPLALGTDTGGSARIPAAFCGIVGLRPTHGALSTDGVLPLAPSLDTVGLLARFPEDVRALWTALTGEARTPTRRPLVGWIPPDSVHPTAPEIAHAAREFADVLVAEEVVVPEADELRSAYRVIQGREAFAEHAERLSRAPKLYDPEVHDRLHVGGAVTATEYDVALSVRDRVRERALALLRRFDLLALPTVPLLPPLIDQRVGEVRGAPVDVQTALLALTSPWSVLGLPAISVPVRRSDGIPMALQLVGPPGAEVELIGAAARLVPRP